MTNVSTRLRWSASAIFALGVGMLLERIVVLEWSMPYCNDPQDGPGWAVFGTPLPYERYAEFSLEYDFVPHFYIVNVLAHAGLLWLGVRPAADRLARAISPKVYWVLIGFGLLLGATVCARHVFAISQRLWHPVASVAHPPYDSYRELRPVGFSLGRHYDCTPSAFWFGPKWHPPTTQ